MRIVYPQYLLILLIIPFFYYLGLLGIKNFKQRRLKLINNRNFNRIGLKDNIKEKQISIYLWLIIIALSAFSLARPTGGEFFTETQDDSKDIVIALDISDSMKAMDISLSGSYSDYTLQEDLKNLSRLSSAKKVIKGFVKNLSGDKVSLVAFSDSAFPLSPLSNDYNSFNGYLDNLDYSYINEGGTDISNALEVAEKRFFNKDKTKIIVVVSDGEEQNNKAVEKARDLAKKNIKVISVGIGSRDGSKIYLGKNVYDHPMYKTYMGQDIITKLNDKVLKEIANESKGRYFELGNENISDSINNLINSYQNKLLNNNINSQKIHQYEEMYQIFVFLAILLIMTEFFVKKIFN